MITLKVAQKLAGLVEEEAGRIGVPVTLCVIDVHGNIVLKQRMDGAKLISLEMAERKAYTAAALDMRTDEMTPLAVPGGPLHTLAAVGGGRYTVLGGGAPLRSGSLFIGAAGVSGGTTEQDIAVLDAAMARLLD
jgi:uncharacterized protein GlcG (DUF336 family)